MKNQQTTTTRTYSELMTIPNFYDRYRYLKLSGAVGQSTFGFDRFINQEFYRSREWKRTRRDVIVRDHGCDMGVVDYDIYGRIIVHHMNPMTPDSITQAEDYILEPEFLISCSHATHNAIHYGELSVASGDIHDQLIERTPHDTSPWR